MDAFKKEINQFGIDNHLPKPMREYYDLGYRPEKIQRRFGFYFKENIDLDLWIREECIVIFLRYFPFPEGTHGLVGKKSR